MLLSIIVPFHNSHEKSRRLIKILSSLDRQDTELVFIDDGGSIYEAELLKLDADIQKCHTTLLRQANRGPGGARNLGFRISKGDYLWFVDSDDEINIDAIDEVFQNSHEEFDFIDFKIKDKRGSKTTIEADIGLNELNIDRSKISNNFGRLCTKVFSRKFWTDNAIKYPENCIFEDNALSFYLPFLTTKFFVSNTIGYIHQVDNLSVTRNREFNPRFLDRLFTAEYGVKKALELNPTHNEILDLSKKFRAIFLIKTLEYMLKMKTMPSTWQYIISRYKQNVRSLFPNLDTEEILSHSLKLTLQLINNRADKNIMEFVWDSADDYEEGKIFFSDMRKLAWKREILLP